MYDDAPSLFVPSPENVSAINTYAVPLFGLNQFPAWARYHNSKIIKITRDGILKQHF
jgi:hypothetical protein